MDSCQYKCNPSKVISPDEVTNDTYTAEFIMMTTEKIIQRIRSLFKERFVYEKKDLVMYINAIKTYPASQINAALTQLVDDKSEYVSDKYGRLGNIVNIGTLYLFQPLELKEKHISNFDRMVPIPYKRQNVIINELQDSKINKTKKDSFVQSDDKTIVILSEINNRYILGIQIGHKSSVA